MDILIYITIFFPMAAAVLCYAVGRFHKAARDRFAIGVTGLSFGFALYILIRVVTGSIPDLPLEISGPNICGQSLRFALDGFRALYGTIAAFMWLMCTLFSKEYMTHYRNRNRYYLFLLLTLGATEGVFFSADFFTTFLFFEIMSFTSYVWVVHDEKKESLRASSTYLAVAVLGGLVMLMGIFILYSMSTHGAVPFYLQSYNKLFAAITLLDTTDGQRMLWIAGICLLFGFGAKAGAFPLHIWLPKAHPVAPAPASALLSGILTKAGIFGILVLSSCLFFGNEAWGNLILVIGVLTMVVGAVLALFSVDLKRTLACSSVSQIGFILVGVGMSCLLSFDGELAVRGSMLHMVNHSLIKLALFMAAGVVFMNVHRLDLNDIRGFGRKKPLLNFIFLMGALGIGGVPLWNGYVSKTLIHESIVEYIELVREGQVISTFGVGMMKGIEWAFLISGGLTVAYMTKLYVAIFIEKNADETVQAKYDSLKGCYMNKESAAALTVSAVLLPLMGFFPNRIMDKAADIMQPFMKLPTTSAEPAFSYFTFANLKGALISLGIGALVYLVIVRLWMMKEHVYVNRWYKYLDLEDMVYRPLLLQILPSVFGFLCRILDSLVDTVVVLLRKTLYRDSKLPHELPEGTPLTHTCACMAGFFQMLGNKTFRRKRPKNVDYEHKFAILYEELSENSVMISRSMSFGLLLFCIGLILTVAYLFIRDIFGI